MFESCLRNNRSQLKELAFLLLERESCLCNNRSQP